MTLTAARPPALAFRLLSTSKIFCTRTNPRFVFEQTSVTLSNHDLGDNDKVFEIVNEAITKAVPRANLEGVAFRYNKAKSRFSFEFPQNNRFLVFLDVDSRLAERLGYGPLTRIDRSSKSAVVHDQKSTIDAENLSKALVFDAGMAIVTLNGSSSIDTYGVDDLAMTTLWPTASGTLKMSEKYSRAVYLPTAWSGQPLVTLQFDIWTLKKDSQRIPLSWQVPFFAGGTFEGRL